MISFWTARRANHAAGIICAYDKNKDILKFFRGKNDRNLDSFYCVVDANQEKRSGVNGWCDNDDKNNEDNKQLLRFELMAGDGFSAVNSSVNLSLFIVPDDLLVNNPFSLGGDFEKLSFKLNLNSQWREVAILAPEVRDNQKIILRFEFSYALNSVLEGDDFVFLRDFFWSKKRDFFDLVKSGVSEVIFPEFRFIERHFESSKKNLLVSFAAIGIPVYKYNTSDFFYGVNADRLIINDSQLEWYLGGFLDKKLSVENCIMEIKENILIRKYNNILTFGLSMGGYGAVLYGSLMGATHIIAFNAELELFKLGSRSNYYFVNKKIVDVKYRKIFRLANEFQGYAYLFYSLQDKTDNYFYGRMTEVVGGRDCTIFVRGINQGHDLGKFVKESNFLLDMIARIFR